MSNAKPSLNRTGELRAARQWSQVELARRSGLSRPAISAIETGRVSPSVRAALQLAASLGCSVEDLFGSAERAAPGTPEWAWPPGCERRFWSARVGSRRLLYPVEDSPLGTVAHDGISHGRSLPPIGSDVDARTLVVAGCDPCGAILAGVLSRHHGIRLIQVGRSSRKALELLRFGLVHAAGVHLADGGAGNAGAVGAIAGPGHRLVRVARWTEGIALEPSTKHRTARQALAAGVSWVGREEGSGADRCARNLFAQSGRVPRGYGHVAKDHRAVASAIASGFAGAGICVQVAAHEARLNFVPVAREDYDLCFRSDSAADPLVAALLETIQSTEYRRLVGELPGYNSTHTGVVVDA